MTKSDPNTVGSMAAYIFELALKGQPETCKISSMSREFMYMVVTNLRR